MKGPKLNKYSSVYVNGVPRHSEDLIAEYTAAGYWGEETLTSRLREVVAHRSESVAIVDGSHRLSYGQLGAHIARLASALNELGVGPGDAVTVQLPNWWEQMAALFAIVELGAVFIPANIRLRGDLEYVLAHTDTKVVVVPDEFHGFAHAELITSMRPRLPHLEHVVAVRSGSAQGHLSFEDLLSEGSGASAARRSAGQPRANDPWEVMFTSGTTSAPKGVVRTHNNTLYTLRIVTDFYGMLKGDGSDVALAVLPVSFIFAQYLCALGALLSGGTLVLQASFDAEEAAQLIERERVTHLGVVPSMVPSFLDVPDLGKYDLSSLRLVSPAGEAVTRERKQGLEEIFGCDVRESYGLAEMTWPLGQSPEAPHEKKLGTTGRSSPGAGLRIVSDDVTDLPTGEAGELLLRGPTLFPGYYRNPEATSASIGEDGWFRSGDLAVVDDDGFYALSGRKKDLIKRGGASILPQDIEDALEGHPSVAGAAVLGLPDDRRGEIACACVVLHRGATTTADDLVEFLKDRLATFKLPERIEFMESLPLSENGKVLKGELLARLAAAGPHP